MADETPAVAGEVDDGVVDFNDLPGRKKYKVVQDVPLMMEHLLKGDSDVPEQYIGPEKLQLIADHNNARVEQTGDATPIIIGHTKDLQDEIKQPPVVGFATNFRVHRLLRKDVQAIHADFHLMEDKLDLIANYPRRSVELWPKRWEIDPIALLGATTPEQDLGLLMLSRPGRPRRYHRIFEDDSMPKDDDKPKKKDAANGGPSVPGEGEGVQQLIAALSNPEVMKLITSAILETAPFKELLSEAGEGGTEMPPPDADGMMHGGEGPPMDAPGGDAPMPGGMDAPGGDPPMGGGPPMGKEAAFYHEGPPERYGMDCDPRDYAAGDMGGGMGGMGGGYPSATNSFIPSESGYGMRGEYYAPSRRHPMHHSYGRAEADDRYARYLAEQEARRLAAMRPPVPRPPVAPPSAIAPERKQQLQQNDVAVRMSRMEKEMAELREQNRKLQREKTISDRSMILQGLQNEGIELNVAEEIETLADFTEEQFGREVERIKRNYSRSPVGIRPVTPVDHVKMTRGSPIDRMSQEERVQYQRKIGEVMREAKDKGLNMTFDEAQAQVDQKNGFVKIKS